MHTQLLRVAAATLLAVAASAQGRVWIVDAAGGGNFTDLPAAAAVATHGDLLVVLPGFYSPFATDQGIAVLGQGAVRIRGYVPWFRGLVEVTALPAGRTFSMRNVTIEHFALNDGIVLANDDGRVHLHDVRVGPQPNSSTEFIGPALAATSCRSVTVTGCTLRGGSGIAATDSRLVVSSSSVAGIDALAQLGGSISDAGAGLVVTRGSVHLSRSDATGGAGLTTMLWSERPREAIFATDAALTLTGDASTSVRAGALAGSPPLAAIIANGGTLHVDPAVAVQGTQGGPPISGSARVITRRIVSLFAAGGQLGGPVNVEIVSPAGDALALLLSVPIDPVPTALGAVYFDPLAALGLVFGAAQNASEHFAFGFTFPNLPQLRGVPIVLQAANYYRATSFLELSNPVVLVLDE